MTNRTLRIPNPKSAGAAAAFCVICKFINEWSREKGEREIQNGKVGIGNSNWESQRGKGHQTLKTRLDQPSKERMDFLNDSWQRVFGDQGVLIVGDGFPSGCEFGLDCMVYEIGPKFQGVSHLPSGFHFIYYSHGSFQRQGVFVQVSASRNLVFMPWNITNEELEPRAEITATALNQLRFQVLQGAFNESLGPYNNGQYSTWQNLSQFINCSVLERATVGLNILISSGNDELEAEDMAHLKTLSKSSVTESLQSVPTSDNCVSYTDFHYCEEQYTNQLYKSQLPDVHREITKIKHDKSTILQHILHENFHDSKELLLGELQLAFVMFMMLYSFHGLQQWKVMLTFISQCENFLKENEDFTCYFIQSLFHELKFIPDDFFDAEISKENFLLPAFSNLISALHEQTSPRLSEHIQRFQKFIDKKFGLAMTKYSIEGPEGHDLMTDVACTPSNADANAALQSELFQSLKEHFVGNSSLSEEQTRLLVGDFDLNKKFISALEKESAKYSWRYPLLYDAMISSGGKEDLLMTSMRILDETDIIPLDNGGDLSKLRNEAMSFLEHEALSYSSNC
jgi:A1 cistron-splicing factor AAR2